MVDLETNIVYNEDCILGMSKLPDECVDLIVADPPFGIKFGAKRSNYNRDGKNVLDGYVEINPAEYYDFTQSWLQECYRILKKTGNMYIVSGWSNLKDILTAIDNVGFYTLNHVIWKYQFGVYTKRKYVSSHYHIPLLVKNKRTYTYNKIDRYPEDVLVINREYWRGKEKPPTKLPVKLVEKFVLTSSNIGDVVLDPFIGSGTTACVAKMHDRKYIGYEIVPKYHEFACNRIENTHPVSRDEFTNGEI